MEIPKNAHQTFQEEEDWYQSQSMLYLKFTPTKFDAYTWNPNDLCFWRSMIQNKASSRCKYIIHMFPESTNFWMYSLTGMIYFFQARELQSQQEQLVWKQELDRKVWHHIN